MLEHGADFLLTVKDNQPTARENIQRLVTAPLERFSPSAGHTNLGRQPCVNKGQLELRILRSRSTAAEELDFPCVERVALLRRDLRQHAPEIVALATSVPAGQLDAAQWLQDSRAALGIENGLHQRLDVSYLDDL